MLQTAGYRTYNAQGDKTHPHRHCFHEYGAESRGQSRSQQELTIPANIPDTRLEGDNQTGSHEK